MSTFNIRDEYGAFKRLLTDEDKTHIENDMQQIIETKQEIHDDTLATLNKTVPGAINELKGLIDDSGIPSGGEVGQYIRKKSTTDKDIEWANIENLTLDSFDQSVINKSGETEIADDDTKIATSKIIRRELGLKQASTDNNLATTDKTVVGGINEVNQGISNINKVVSDRATETNKLVSNSEMGDAISSVEANHIYKTAEQGSFGTKAELLGATTFYNADGTEATPTKNDVAYVLADESHDNSLTKYVVASVTEGTIVWAFVITISSVSFTQAQLDAINSTATEDKINSYSTHIVDTNNPHAVTKEQVELGNVANTGDSNTPEENGDKKFTTGGAYTELNKKVDKVDGKGLSTNDFTTEEKNKLDNLIVYSAEQPSSADTKFWVQTE